MSQLDPHSMMHNIHTPQSYPNKPMFQQNYSFDDATSAYYDRMNILKQAQSNSFNMELLNGVNQPNNEVFHRNNPKRNTLKRAQNVIDNSVEELHNMNNQSDINMMNLSPQQQQQLLIMRQQQYSNNSSGQESGLGSSVYTNSAHGTHDLLIQRNLLNNISPNSDKKTDTTLDNTSVPPVQLPRRKSLPSIVKTKSFKEDEVAHSSSELNDKNQDIYIIENGIRKRVTEKSNSALQQNKLGADTENKNEEDNLESRRLKTDYEYDETPQLPRKIVLESVSSLTPNSQSNSKRVSMPSIPAYLSSKFANKSNLIFCEK